MSQDSFSFTRVWAGCRNVLLHYRRDISVIRMIMVLPLMQLVIFGYVLNITPKHLPAVIIDQDHSASSRELMRRLAYTEYFRFNPNVTRADQAQEGLYTGEFRVVLTIPPKWESSCMKKYVNPLLLQVDASDPLGATQSSSVIETVLADMRMRSEHHTMPFQEDKPFGKTGSSLYVQNLYNETMETKNAITPPLIGIVLTMTLINLTAISLVKERESGTMEVLLTTPIRPFEVMLGKLIPNILVGYVQIAIIIVVSVFLMGIPFRGSVPVLLLMSFPFILANLSFGFLLSTSAKSQLEASTAAILVLLPSILLSGFIFPVPGMPWWAQAISAVLPATYFTSIARGVILKGAGFVELWPVFWPLCLLSALVVIAGLLNYRETLE